jgi:hypothetical protein
MLFLNRVLFEDEYNLMFDALFSDISLLFEDDNEMEFAISFPLMLLLLEDSRCISEALLLFTVL